VTPPIPVHYQTGYNDIFGNFAAGYCNSPAPANTLPPWTTEHTPVDQAMQAAKASGAKYVRFNVWWDLVEYQAGTFRWKLGPTSGPPYDLEAVRNQAKALEMKVLPVVFGAPGWLGAGERLPCQPNDPTNTNYYPLPSSANAFANFVMTVIDFFDVCEGVIDAVEIWNEPNLPKAPIRIVNPNHFGALLAAVISKMKLRTVDKRKTIVSGSLGINTDDDKWQPYLYAFANQCYGYSVGVHAYGALQTPRVIDDPTDPVSEVSTYIMNRFKAFRNYLTNECGLGLDIWVTETGTYSTSPLSPALQGQIFTRLFGPGTGFDAEPRCAAAFVHRLYPDLRGGSAANNYVGGTDRPGQTFEEFATYQFNGRDATTQDAKWLAKPAVSALSAVWS
jgi:hypothetical protein